MSKKNKKQKTSKQQFDYLNSKKEQYLPFFVIFFLKIGFFLI